MKNKIILLLMLLVLMPSAKTSAFEKKTAIKKITIYWDTSFSMKNKDIEKELEFLTSYFNKTPNAVIDLITFSNSIDVQKRFNVVNSNWNDLKDVLLKTNYDGVAIYDVLLEESTSDINFLFTDGIEVIDKLKLSEKIATYIINSSKQANYTVLEEQGYFSNGNFIDLRTVNIPEALTILNSNGEKNGSIRKQIVKKEENNDNEFIVGSVHCSEGALYGATISINGETGVVTDSNGEFRIKAAEGDVLIASYMGMKTQEILIDKERKFEILMVNDETELEEVVVKGKSKPIIEEVETGYGKVNKDRLGYAVQSISSEDLPGGREDNISLHGKFSGITNYGGNDDISQMVIRGSFSFHQTVYPLIVIDGVQQNRSDSETFDINSTNFIDPNNIANVTILKGLAATNRYGGQGGNGVILITTKTSLGGEGIRKEENTALVKNNDFNEKLSLLNTNINEKYIEELNQFQTLNEVYNYYLKQRINYLNNPLYFVNVSDYVLQFGNKELASKILSNCLEMNVGSISILKLVAYKAEMQQDFFFAKRLYEKIAILKPYSAQSYRDLALIYQETGYYREAFNIYKEILTNNYLGVNFSGIQKPINSELSRLIKLHSNELDLSSFSKDDLLELDYDARIVFEYNDDNANFELQFVNPQKKFFSWSHTKEANEMRLYEEKLQGFNTEEFLLIDAEKGVWQINIENKMLQNKKPIIIKYTIYKNYGNASETKEAKTIILNNIKQKYLLEKITI